MKKSADSNNTKFPPSVVNYTPEVPLLVSNRVPTQTHISVFLEFVNEMHTR